MLLICYVILQLDTREQLRNVQRLRVVRYQYARDYCHHAGIGDMCGQEPAILDTGLIAQEVQRVLPEAVTSAGNLVLPGGRHIDNFLVVNKVRRIIKLIIIIIIS